MKYVMFRCVRRRGLVQLVPLIFPDFMVHADADKYGGHWLRRVHGMVEARPLSAGFIRMGGTLGVDQSKPGKIAVTDGPQTYGESETLKLKARSEDGSIIALYDYNNGLF